MGIHLLPPLFKQVLEGGPKYGEEKSATFYPTLNYRDVAADGFVTRYVSLQTWAQIHDGAGNNHDDYSTFCTVSIYAHYATNTWLNLDRSIFSFDSRAIEVGSLIVSAVLSWYTYDQRNTLGGSPALGLVGATPATPGALSNSDYGQLGTTLFAPTIAWSSLPKGGWNTFTLNEAGKAYIKGGQVNSFGLRESTYDLANTAPPWVASQQIIAGGYTRDYALQYSPKLAVTWRPPL